MEDQKPKKNKFDVERVKLELMKLAKTSCKKCHGTGYYGTHVVSKKLMLCPCVYKKLYKMKVEKVIEENRKKNANKKRDKKAVSKAGGSIPEPERQDDKPGIKENDSDIEGLKEPGNPGHPNIASY